jgi:type IV secretory pathway TrbL component
LNFIDLTIVTGIIGSIMAAFHEAAKARAGLIGHVVAITVGLAVGIFNVWIAVSIARRIRWGRRNTQDRIQRQFPAWQLVCVGIAAILASFAWASPNMFLGHLASREVLHLVF